MAKFKISISAMVGCVAVLAAVPLLAADVSREVLRESLARQVLWTKSLPVPEATFIPNEVLRSEGFDQLPLSGSSRSVLPRDLARNREIESGRRADEGPHCSRSSETTSTGDPWREATTLAEAVGMPGRVAVVGDVVARLEGWSNLWVAPGTLAYIKVKEVLAEPAAASLPSAYSPGTMLAVHLEGGRAEVEGTVLCRQGPDVAPIEEGGTLLVIGEPVREELLQLWGFSYFPVVDEMVLPQRYQFIRERERLPLEALRREVLGDRH